MQSIFSEEVCGRGMTVKGCRFKLGHYCFMDVGWGSEREELVGHSRANHEEALVVCHVVEGAVKGLLSGRKPNVGVITPYIAQRGVIERELEKRGIDTTACEVNTVDGFQGREKDVIVLSCVRAMADRGLGFLSDERRMNVALTRAKYALIIVGHAETLQKWSPAWGSLIDDARKRGCYQVLTNNKIQEIPPKNWYEIHCDSSFLTH
jgi:senataxin